MRTEFICMHGSHLLRRHTLMSAMHAMLGDWHCPHRGCGQHFDDINDIEYHVYHCEMPCRLAGAQEAPALALPGPAAPEDHEPIPEEPLVPALDPLPVPAPDDEQQPQFHSSILIIALLSVLFFFFSILVVALFVLEVLL
ncbi:hypothetical protein CF326_g4607 [Tilletia indica]|nr:hypothetical protein CF326_g4607 [Tilletia indica]